MGILSSLFGRKEIEDNVSNTQTYDTSDGSFHFTVDDVFTIMGRGTIVTGKVDSGEIREGETVLINGSVSTVIIGIEKFRMQTDMATAGENCGLLLRDIEREQVHKGDVLTK